MKDHDWRVRKFSYYTRRRIHITGYTVSCPGCGKRRRLSNDGYGYRLACRCGHDSCPDIPANSIFTGLRNQTERKRKEHEMLAKDLIPALHQKDACDAAMNEWLLPLLKNEPDITVQQTWDKCLRPDWMIWFAARFTDTAHRTYVQIALDIVRKTPVGDNGRVVADLLTDQRSIDALDIVDHWLDGDATLEDVPIAVCAATHAARAAATPNVAMDDAYAAARAAAYAAMDAARAAYATAYAAYDATEDAAEDAAYAAMDAATAAGTAYSASRAAYATALAFGADIVREHVPEITFNPTESSE